MSCRANRELGWNWLSAAVEVFESRRENVENQPERAIYLYEVTISADVESPDGPAQEPF